MDEPCLFSLSVVHTRTHPQHTPETHILSKGHSEAVITSILQLCYRCYPLSSPEPSSNKVPSPITQLLSLNTSLLHYPALSTLSATHSPTPVAIYHRKYTLLNCLFAPVATYQSWKLHCFVRDGTYTIRHYQSTGLSSTADESIINVFWPNKRPKDCKYHSLSLHFWSNNTVCLEMNYSHCCIFMFSYSRQNIMYFIKYNGWFSHQLTLGGKVL